MTTFRPLPVVDYTIIFTKRSEKPEQIRLMHIPRKLGAFRASTLPKFLFLESPTNEG